MGLLSRQFQHAGQLAWTKAGCVSKLFGSLPPGASSTLILNRRFVMSSKPIEFRYLHAVTNGISGDRTTVGLMHWDGIELRFARSLARMADAPAHFERAVASIADQIHATQKGIGSGPFLFHQALDLLFPCQTRGGDALVWSTVRRGFSADSDAHFMDLATMLGLVRAHPSRTPPDVKSGP